MSTESRSPGLRLRSLDGLRGFAALAVVVHHCFLSSPSPALAEAGRGGPRFPAVDWWLTYTPLHLFWAGTEAVIVFFVLSGFVLVRAAGGRNFAWRTYYPSRLLRLYLPVWGAIILGLAWFEAVPRTVQLGGSWWLNSHHERLVFPGIPHDLVLVNGTSWLVSPLWSLRWEVWFSLLLPLAVFGALRRPWAAAVQAAVLVLLIGLGGVTGHASLVYLPMFGLGALLAHQHDGVRALASRLTRGGWVVVGVAACVLLTSSWTLERPLAPRLVPVETVGALLVVFAFAHWPAARTLAERSRVQWLGKRSFSLYLVHEPIVVSVALLLGRPLSPWPTLAVALPASLLVAELFYRCVERPSHRAAQGLKRPARETIPAAVVPEAA